MFKIILAPKLFFKMFTLKDSCVGPPHPLLVLAQLIAVHISTYHTNCSLM